MSLFRWGNDKFDTGYRIFTIFYNRWFDVYLFDYPTGSLIPKHKDPGKRGAHYRLNVEICKAVEGGVFSCKGPHLRIFERVYLFRADRYYHRVSRVDNGRRLVFSVGITIPRPRWLAKRSKR